MKQFLLHLSIGPVQSFIEQARKTQDLFAGSALITLLREHAMAHLIEHQTDLGISGLTFITPFIKSNETFVTQFRENQANNGKPEQHLNKLECLITIEESKLTNLITKLEQKVKDIWINHSMYICNHWSLSYDVFFKDQIEQLLEITIICNEVNDHQGGYYKAYAQQQAAITAIKRARLFNQLDTDTEAGKKCMVDKTWNIRIYRLTDNEDAVQARKKLFADSKLHVIENENKVKIWHLAKGEGLSAISIMKRMLLNEPHEYPSTARVALWNTLVKLKEEQAFIDFDKGLEDNDHSNDQLYYKDNLNEKYFNKYEIFAVGKRKEKLEALNKLYIPLAEAAKLKGCSFTKYYAVMKFDGDNSNKWLSGIWLDEPETHLEAFHREYSKAQSEFVQQLTNELMAPRGKVVYAGEDFLILFNIEFFAEILELIYKTYQNCVAVPLNKFRPTSHNDAFFSFSAGITIAHYKEPLQFVLDTARDMEKAAKKNGRNMLGITVLNAAGGSTSLAIPWQQSGAQYAHHYIKYCIDAFNSEKISTSFLRVIQNQLRFYRGNIPDYLFDHIFQRAVTRSINDEKLTVTAAQEVSDVSLPHSAIREAIQVDSIHLIIKNEIVAEFQKIATYLNSDAIKIINFFYIIDFIHRKTHESSDTINNE